MLTVPIQKRGSPFFLIRLQNQCERHTQEAVGEGGVSILLYYLEESLSYFSVVSLDPTKQVGIHFKSLSTLIYIILY